MATKRLSGMTTSSSVPDNGGDHSGGGGSAGGYVDDVFSTYVYEGNGSTQQIENGIDLAGEGGLVWIKNRTSTSGIAGHFLLDTVQPSVNGSQAYLSSNSNEAADGSSNMVTSFDSNGFGVGANNRVGYNGTDYVSWTFRKAPKFFDCVSWTGIEADQTISHGLENEPGCIITKCTSSNGPWYVYHRSLTNSSESFINLSSNGAANISIGQDVWGPPTSTTFKAAKYLGQKDNEEYVAYLFAHDDSEEGMIQCGSYTGNGNADGPEIDLGWEPQYLLIKAATGKAEAWNTFDVMRGITSGGNDPVLQPSTPDTEYGGSQYLSATATGFKIDSNIGSVNTANQEYIYMAIRRPNKPAEEFEPEELFAVQKDFLNAYSSAGFPVDMVLGRGYATQDWRGFARFIGGNFLVPNLTNAEASLPAGEVLWDSNSGFYQYTNNTPNIWHQWRRAPGFFDVVAYEGDGQLGREVPHNLGVKPEMMWLKMRSSSKDWYVYSTEVGATHRLALNKNSGPGKTGAFNDTEPTGSAITLGNGLESNGSGGDYITYLWASVPGICDIGSYSGTGVNEDIDCGFTNGARFVLLKRTDAAGDWMLFDTLTGISSSESPMLKLNEMDAPVSGSYIKPHPKGFTVTSNLTGIDGAEYIYMAIA